MILIESYKTNDRQGFFKNQRQREPAHVHTRTHHTHKGGSTNKSLLKRTERKLLPRWKVK